MAPGIRSTQIIAAHLNALQAGEGYTIDVAGKADLSRLVIVTHSRGGPSALHYLSDTTSRPVQALVMLTPAAATDVQIPATLPTALVISECDGDVHTDQPLTYWEQLPPLRPTLTTVYTIPGGTHNAFNAQLGEDPFQVCEAARLIDSQHQRDFAAKFVPGFFDIALALGHLGIAQ